jgi:transcriptional regulator with XRE-family HTH domain
MALREETMGQRLRRLREAADMSQPELARAAGVPVGTLRNWEQGRRIPRFDTAAAVAWALGVSLDDLAGEPPPRQRLKKGG